MVIDTEFTGLINGRDVSIFDTPQEYYTTLLNGASDFLLIQYGLCAFYWDDLEKNYKNDAYNFYLFPRGRPGPEKMFLCQSSSLDFLASQGFDFNKLIKEGNVLLYIFILDQDKYLYCPYMYVVCKAFACFPTYGTYIICHFW